ncbi:UDP-N-acetyl glucosamine 2-epimerase [Chromohalobacter japonicus]|uniref:UDP-N-acetyl glucosamine 2-epimerase n=1 Tax=Chromohalobacter japonicus TaxID=223900 RepID=UPI000AB4191B|nr:UDP-N-acetyl glucosamine 2-epimerase [Chromohalobacter japonicus]
MIKHSHIAKNFWKQSRLYELKKSDLLLVRHDNNCAYLYRGVVYSQIVDSVIDVARKSSIDSVTIAKPFSKYYGDMAYNSPFIFNWSFFLILLWSKFLQKTFGLRFSSKYRKKATVKFWRKILMRVCPKVVIATQPCRYLCVAAKELGVKVYDYQHGVISKDHLWYGKKMPNEMSFEELPHGILCWDGNSARSLNVWAKKRGVAVVVLGNPWVDRFLNEDPNDELVQEEIKQTNLDVSIKPNILVSLQWGLVDNYYSGSDFNGIACDALIKVIAKTHHKYNWLLRLHPVQMHGPDREYVRKKLNDLFGGMEGVQWESISKVPLPLVLKKSQLHITDMSTVVIEAAWLGVPSGILNPYLRPGERLENLYKEERDSGIAVLLNQNEAEIEFWIEENASKIFCPQQKGDINIGRVGFFLRDILKR